MNAQHIIGQISDTILHGDFCEASENLDSNNSCTDDISDLISVSIENDVPAPLISTEALDKSMLEIIDRFKNDDVMFMEMIARANLTGEARDTLADHVEDPEPLSKGTMLLAAVEGEYHRHGKDIISSLSRGIGFNTIDLGTGVPIEDILDAVDEHRPEYVGISASTRATIPELKEITDKISADRALVNTKVILGGFLAGDDAADDLGADYLCPNIDQSIDLLVTLANSSN
jgi:5-methyltetrahydrofolate--homocysteine methyltransferase